MSIAHKLSLALSVSICPVTVALALFLLRRDQSKAPLTLSRVAESRLQWPYATPFLVCFRIFCCLWCVLVFVAQHSWEGQGVGVYLFYTAWSYVVLFLYFALATAAHLRLRMDPVVPSRSSPGGLETTSVVVLGVSVEAEEDRALEPNVHQEWRLALARTCQVMLALATTNVLVVDILLWAVLFPTAGRKLRETLCQFWSINQHGTNFLMVLVEILLNDIPARKYDMGWVLIFACAYGVFTSFRLVVTPQVRHCFLERCGRFENGRLGWPYFFMDMSSLYAPLMYLGLMAVNLLFYQALYRFRTFLHEKGTPRSTEPPSSSIQTVPMA